MRISYRYISKSNKNFPSYNAENFSSQWTQRSNKFHFTIYYSHPPLSFPLYTRVLQNMHLHLYSISFAILLLYESVVISLFIRRRRVHKVTRISKQFTGKRLTQLKFALFPGQFFLLVFFLPLVLALPYSRSPYALLCFVLLYLFVSL